MKGTFQKLASVILIMAMVVTSVSLDSLQVSAATKKPTKITLNVKSKTLTVGKSFQLKVKSVKPTKASKAVTYKSSNKKVATVSTKGKIKAKKAGKTTITVTSKKNKKVKAKCKIVVKSKVKPTKKPTMTKKPTATNTPMPTATLEPTATVEPTATRKPTATVEPTATPKPTVVLEPTVTVEPTAAIEATATPKPVATGTQKLTATPIPTATPNPILKNGITRAEWIVALLDAMECEVNEDGLERNENGGIVYSYSDIKDHAYAKEIQTAYYQGYLPEDTTHGFAPEEEASREFVVMTAVNALGVESEEEPNCDDKREITYKGQIAYALAEEMVSLESGMFYPNRSVSKEEQKKILERFAAIRIARSGIVEKTVVDMTDNVVAPTEENFTGDYELIQKEGEEDSFRIKITKDSLEMLGIKEEELNSGKIVVLPQTEHVPSGVACDIHSIEESENEYLIYGKIPEDISKVYEHIDVAGTIRGNQIEIEPEEYVQVIQTENGPELIINEETINARTEGTISDLYSNSWELVDADNVKGEFSVAISELNYVLDIDFPFARAPQVNEVSITLKEKASFHLKVEGSTDKKIFLGSAPIRIPYVPGLAVNIVFYAKVAVDGSVSYEATLSTQQTFGIKNESVFKEVPNPVYEQTLSADVTVKAGPDMNVSLIWPCLKTVKKEELEENKELKFKKEINLFDANIFFGIGMNASSTTHHSGNLNMICVDGNIFIFLDLGIISKDCSLPDSWHKEWEVITKDNSPLKKNIHMENGSLVSECTWDALQITLTPTPKITESGNQKPTPTDEITEDEKVTITPEPTLPPSGEGNYGSLHNPVTDANGNVTYSCIYFGNYPQSDATGAIKEPIKWRILSINGDDAFLVAERNLDVMRYDENYKDENGNYRNVTWETCTMRSWLNGYGSDANGAGIDYSVGNFIDRAFNSAEQAAILTTYVVNVDNPEYGTEGGNSTQDKIFLLSIDEVSNSAYGFLPYKDSSTDWLKDAARQRTNTDYVNNGGSLQSEWTEFMKNNAQYDVKTYGGYWWWLRSPGDRSYGAAYVSNHGYVYHSGCYVNGYDYRYGSYGIKYNAVCPALHMNLSSSTVWSIADSVMVER